jgi:hypothetical protein
MAKVLVCIEDEDVGGRDHAYYEKIRPGFVQRRHSIRLTTCAQVWDSLAEDSVDWLLMLVRSRQSCCWRVCREVRGEWRLPYPPPLIQVIVEHLPEKTDHPDYPFERESYLNNPNYALWFDTVMGVTPYFREEAYSRLYDFIEWTFSWEGRTLVRRMESGLFGTRFFDRERFEDHITVLFPGPRDRWSWTFCRSSYHPIMELRVHTPPPERIIPVVCSLEGNIWAVDTWDRFLEFIADESLDLADEMDQEDILAVFSIFQQKHLMKKVNVRGSPAWRNSALPKYVEIVKPPTYSLVEGEHQLRLWTISQPDGKLEEWLFRQRGADFQVQSWVREENFGSGVQRGFDWHAIPPRFTLP